MKKKYTKCQCCPHYVKIKNKWTCAKSKCFLGSYTETETKLETRQWVITTWINANKENKNE